MSADKTGSDRQGVPLFLPAVPARIENGDVRHRTVYSVYFSHDRLVAVLVHVIEFETLLPRGATTVFYALLANIKC